MGGTFFRRWVSIWRAGRIGQGRTRLPLQSLVRLELAPATLGDKELKAQVIAIDGPFGNLVTNVDSDLFAKLGYKLGKVTFKLGDSKLLRRL